MDLAELLASRGDLLLLAGTRADVQQLVDLALQSGSHIGVAGRGQPLLSALSVAENVALPAMYHRNLPLEKVVRRLAAPAEALGLDAVMDLRPANLDRNATLRAKILRCLARECGVLLLPAPPPNEAVAARDAIAAHGGGVRLWVACLSKDRDAYAGLNLQPVTLWKDA